jgi:hypothetical protein
VDWALGNLESHANARAGWLTAEGARGEGIEGVRGSAREEGRRARGILVHVSYFGLAEGGETRVPFGQSLFRVLGRAPLSVRE